MLGEGPRFSTPKSEWKLGPSQGRNQDGDKRGEERKHWRFWEKREREAVTTAAGAGLACGPVVIQDSHPASAEGTVQMAPSRKGGGCIALDASLQSRIFCGGASECHSGRHSSQIPGSQIDLALMFSEQITSEPWVLWASSFSFLFGAVQLIKGD